MQDKKSERKKMLEELTRTTILKSATSVFVEQGIKKFTMEKVSAQAGIAKGTLYLYYKNKGELLSAVVNYCFGPLMEDFEKVSNKQENAITKIETYIALSANYAEKNKNFFYELRSTLYGSYAQKLTDQDSWYWKLVSIFARTFDEGVASKQLRPMNSKKMACYFVDSICSLMTHRILSTTAVSAEEDARELMDLYLGGLAI